MINFKRIKWRNFLGSGDDWTEIDLNNKTTTLITGRNGSGKSLVKTTKLNILDDDENEVFVKFKYFLNSK